MKTKSRKRRLPQPLYKIDLQVKPPVRSRPTGPLLGHAPWKTSPVPELFVHRKNTCQLTPAGRQFVKEEMKAPLGVRIRGLATVTFKDYARLAAQGVVSDWNLDLARRTMHNIVCLIEDLWEFGDCELEIAQLATRFAELAMWAHQAARAHREWDGSESALAAKHPLPAEAATALLDALRILTELGLSGSPDHAAVLALMKELAVAIPADLNAA